MADNLDIAVARLDERVKNHDSFIEQIAKDLERMAAAYEELVRSNQRISLLEQDLVNMKDAQRKLSERADARELAQNRITGLALYDVVKLLLAVGMGIALDHYGIRLP
jgi:regulator of replication initiation timing